MVLGLKRNIPKPLLEADAPWGGAHERSRRGAYGLLVVTRWPVPWPFASYVVPGFNRMKPKPLLEAEAPWSGAHDRPGT